MGVDAGQGRNQSGKKSKFSSSFSQQNKRSSVEGAERPCFIPRCPLGNFQSTPGSPLSPVTNVLRNYQCDCQMTVSSATP